jgi:Mg-chelatase subunit ChlD
MVAFENPTYLLLLLVLPVFWFAQKKYVLWQQKTQEAFANKNALEKLLVNQSKNRILKNYLFLGAVFFLILALANPKFGTRVENVKGKGVELVFAVDVSKSMLCKDIQPSRLEKTKQLVSQIINQLGTDRIGMIAYAGDAFPIMPMSNDYSLAKMHLQSLNTDIVSSQGTAIAYALEMGISFFDNPKSGKAIILLTDGEDHGEDAEDLATEAKKKGIKIITIGIGTEKGGTISVVDQLGNEQVKRDKEGQVVITKLNASSLKEIAQKGSGNYIYGTSSNEVISQLKDNLEKIEKTEFKSQQLAQKQSQFQWFLALAIVLLCIDFFFIER